MCSDQIAEQYNKAGYGGESVKFCPGFEFWCDEDEVFMFKRMLVSVFTVGLPRAVFHF